MDEPKDAAAEAALAMSECSGGFWIAAEVSGSVALAGVGTIVSTGGGASPIAGPIAAGAAAGAASFGLTASILSYAAAVLEGYAADPPCFDYHLVARVTPRNVELPPLGSDTGAIWNEFNRTQIEFADAIAALVSSFERLAGARLDLRKPGANADLLARRITTQRQAIRHNAATAKRRIHALLELRSRVNAVWRPNAEAIRASAGAISGEARQQAAAKVWYEITPTLERALGGDERLDEIKSFIAKAVARTTFEVPDEVLNSRWNEAMINMEKRLAVFAGERALTPLRHELDSRA